MHPKEFLLLANELIKPRANEAALRSCVSRSYYALFNLMTHFIENNVERLSRTAADHKKVCRYLQNCGIEEVEMVASSLNDLREERNDSDYKLDLDKFRDESTVTLIFKKASIAFRSFERTIGNRRGRKRLVKGIQRYRENISS